MLLVAAQMANVALTMPAQKFRFASGVYVMSLVLVVGVAARLAAGRSDDRGLGLSSPA